MQYTLIIEDRNGRIANELIFEHGTLTLGRLDHNDIQLASNSVSRQHARIHTEGGRCYVTDLNSSNGVYVDGQRVYGSREIVSGSQIRVGDYLLLLRAQKEGQPGGAAKPYVVDAMQYPRLVRVGDVLEGETYTLTKEENPVGRTEDNTVVLSDPSVSRRHATVVNNNGQYVAIDVGSSNGTRINNHVLTRPTLINNGDVIRFGNVRFVFAAPGEDIDLSQYGGYLGGSNRGLVIAVTVLALLLVLVASGIGAFVVMDDPEDGKEETQTPVVSPEDRARRLKAEGDELATGEHWNDAIAKYMLALDFDSDFREAADALALAQAEFDALQRTRQAHMNLQTARIFAQEGNLTEATQVYNRERDRLLGVPRTSRYWAVAEAHIRDDIDPALIRFHRDLAEQRLGSAQFAEATVIFDQIMTILQARTEAGTGAQDEETRTWLWQALERAGDAASEAQDFRAAVDFYERLQGLGELPDSVARRLQRARSRL